MFPNTIFIFIIVIVLNIITKSISDKKKIEMAKEKRKKQLMNRTNTPQATVVPLNKEKQTITRDEMENLFEKEVKSKEPERTESENIYHEKPFKDQYSDDDRKESLIEKKKNKNRKGLSHSMLKSKNDIVKGIIYSEILSDPKGLRNQRKSI